MQSSSLLNGPLTTYDDNRNPISYNTIISMAAHNLSHIAGVTPAGHTKRRRRSDSTPLPTPNRLSMQNGELFRFATSAMERIAALESTVILQQKEIDSLKSAFRQLTSDASLSSSPGSLAESFADISIISAALPMPDISGSSISRSKRDDQLSKSVATRSSKVTSTRSQKANSRVRFSVPTTTTVNSVPSSSRSSNHVKIDHKTDLKTKAKKTEPSKKLVNKRKNRQRGSCFGHQLIIILRY
ncbi:hypothetical protein SNEBB_006215 [Seison nebaliae]|nr:hypothetical protein SNEBB_006215 [Seison nebaliae]